MISVARADIAVFSQDGRLQLIVEVKNKKDATKSWAAAMRANLSEYLALSSAPFFLLAMPQLFCLWKNTPSSAKNAEPDYEIDATSIVTPFLGTDLSVNDISGQGLELIIASWLHALVNSELTLETAPPNHRWLFDSGLYEAIKHGSVKTEATL